MATQKPDLTRVWANGAPPANVVDPDTTTPGKVNAGWQAEVPPFEHFNFLQKWFTQGLAHFNEQGIGVWDANTTYPVDALVKGSDGRLYFSVSEQSNNDPTSDGGNNWVESPITSGANFSNSVADMKATKYKNNILVVTKSFHNISIEDTKGSSIYLILSSDDYSGTPDEIIDHTLDNGNIAKLLHYDRANIYQLGARDDSLNSVSILNSAFSELESLCIPDEDFEFEGSIQLNKEGFSMYSSSGTLTHRPTAINQPFIEVISDDVSIRGISFFGLGSRAVNRQPETLLFANCILLQGSNCSGLKVDSCNFEQNAHGVRLVDCSSSKITNCNTKFTASYCYHLSGCEDVILEGNYAEGSGADGFKTTDQNSRLIIDSNISVGHRRDGFDLFDGFQQSVLSNNIAKDNYLNGFECKGTPSADYNFRDSTVIGNLAQGNNTDPTVVVGSQSGAGFSVVTVRGATFTGNISTENINMGWIIENCQEDIFNGNSSNKNGAHGYYIGPSANVSRTSLVGNQAYDNSADSTNTYDGFHFGVQAFCNVIACESHKGTSGSNNDQRYGYGFTAGANISLISCHASSNVSGDLGGDSGNSKLVMLPNWTQQDWTRSNFSTSRSVDASTVTTQQLANAFCTLLSDLEDLGYIK